MIKDTVQEAHRLLQEMTTPKHYDRFYKGQPGYPGEKKGQWYIVSKEPTVRRNCACVYEPGVLYPGSMADFEEGWSKQVDWNEKIV